MAIMERQPKNPYKKMTEEKIEQYEKRMKNISQYIADLRNVEELLVIYPKDKDLLIFRGHFKRLLNKLAKDL